MAGGSALLEHFARYIDVVCTYRNPVSCLQTFWQRINGFRNVLPSGELHLYLKIRPSEETFDESNIHRNLRYCDRCHRGRRKLGNRFPGSKTDLSFPSTPRSCSNSRRIFSNHKFFAYQQFLFLSSYCHVHGSPRVPIPLTPPLERFPSLPVEVRARRASNSSNPTFPPRSQVRDRAYFPNRKASIPTKDPRSSTRLSMAGSVPNSEGPAVGSLNPSMLRRLDRPSSRPLDSLFCLSLSSGFVVIP